MNQVVKNLSRVVLDLEIRAAHADKIAEEKGIAYNNALNDFMKGKIESTGKECQEFCQALADQKTVNAALKQAQESLKLAQETI